MKTGGAPRHPEKTEAGRLRLVQPQPAEAALGIAVGYLAGDPAFAHLPFGDWSQVLIGQINRGHYAFVVDGDGRVQGFVGWALTTEDKAEVWLNGGGLSFADAQDGDCVVFNGWKSSSPEAQRFLVANARKLVAAKRLLYWRRRYGDGPLRPFRLPVSRHLASHVARAEAEAEAGEAYLPSPIPTHGAALAPPPP